ncbi:MAG: Uma2 family endonuclease [Emticicia sp.]
MEVLESINYEAAYELERGKPMPSKNHNRLQIMLAFVLMQKYDELYDILSEADLELSTGWAVPDLVIYPKLEYDWIHDEIKMTQVPITTIEILSPKQSIADLVIKAKDKFLAAGVKSSWIIVPPLKQITILYPDGTSENYTTGLITDKVTGVEIELDQIFR